MSLFDTLASGMGGQNTDSLNAFKNQAINMIFQELGKEKNIAKMGERLDTIKTGIQSVLDGDTFKKLPENTKKMLMTKLQEIGKLKPAGSGMFSSIMGGRRSKKRSNKIRKSKKSKKSRKSKKSKKSKRKGRK